MISAANVINRQREKPGRDTYAHGMGYFRKLVIEPYLVKDACSKAKMILLEPIMNVEIYIPSHYMGDITGSLNSKRGRIMGMEETGDLKKIVAHVPIAEMFKFSNELRSITGGRGSFEMDFAHYEEVPAMIAQKVIDAAKKEHELAVKE